MFFSRNLKNQRSHRSQWSIFFFHVVSKINVVSVVSDHGIFYEVSKISVVSLVSDEVVFHIAMNICVVSVVIIKLSNI